MRAVLGAFLIFLLLDPTTLARIIAGEAGNCPWVARLAVAYVAANRAERGIFGGWYGDAEPTPADIYLAGHFVEYPDPTAGAMLLFSLDDLRLPVVQRMLHGNFVETARFLCAGGTGLSAWRVVR